MRMDQYSVQYESDGEIAEYPFAALRGTTIEMIIRIALSQLFLNDCSPGEDWRILDQNGNVLSIFWAGYEEFADSSAARYYNRPSAWPVK